MVTQCPIRPGRSYTYRYNATGQEGTLWWHAHSSMLRATVHGAIIIKPRNGEQGYPFPKPDKEEIIMLGTRFLLASNKHSVRSFGPIFAVDTGHFCRRVVE